MQNPFKKRGRKLRLWIRRPDVNTLAAGLSALAFGAALGAMLPMADGHSYWKAATISVALAFGAFGVGLLVSGFSRRVPLVDIEEPWNSKYDQLRHATERFT